MHEGMHATRQEGKKKKKTFKELVMGEEKNGGEDVGRHGRVHRK